MLEEKGFSEAVIIGGAAVVGEFMNAGLVDDIVMIVEPVLFGEGGLPLLTNVERDHTMRLMDGTKVGADGVRLHYRIDGR